MAWVWVFQHLDQQPPVPDGPQQWWQEQQRWRQRQQQQQQRLQYLHHQR
jgi:hypothetical protein